MGTQSSLSASIAPAGPSVAELARNPDKCIELVRPHTQGLEENDLISYFTDPMATSAQVLSVVERVPALLADMRQHTPTYDRSQIELLAPAAVALAHLHGRSLSTSAASTSAANDKLELAAKTRASLHLSAAFVADRGLVSPATVERLQRMGNGYNDTSAAILGYVQLHMNAQGQVVDRSPTSREELDAAREQAMELAAIGAGRSARDQDDASLVDEKRRVYHFVVTTYNKLRSVVRYLRYELDDAETFTPSLGNKSPKRAAKSEEPVAPTPVPSDPTGPAGPSDESPLEE